MSDIHIRKDGRAGRITLTRPKALNALTHAMCGAVEAALLEWLEDDAVALVILDAEGEKAFCAGGDIQELYAAGRAGDHAYGQRFWRDEYRMNALVAEYPKPVVAFLQGFTMGGGVGLGCHAALRVVGESSRIAMPECGIGLLPDVGGTHLLAHAPGRLGAYLGLTAARMGPGDALHAGFADRYLPDETWPDIIRDLCETGAPELPDAEAPASDMAASQAEIDRLFAPTTLVDLIVRLDAEESELAQQTRKQIGRNSPLAMAATLTALEEVRARDMTLREALALEYRFTHRATRQSDFLEGVRAAIIDRDRAPRWRHALDGVPAAEVAAMLAPPDADSPEFHDVRRQT